VRTHELQLWHFSLLLGPVRGCSWRLGCMPPQLWQRGETAAIKHRTSRGGLMTAGPTTILDASGGPRPPRTLTEATAARRADSAPPGSFPWHELVAGGVWFGALDASNQLHMPALDVGCGTSASDPRNPQSGIALGKCSGIHIIQAPDLPASHLTPRRALPAVSTVMDAPCPRLRRLCIRMRSM